MKNLVLLQLTEEQILGLLFCINNTIASGVSDANTLKKSQFYKSKQALQGVNNALSDRLLSANRFNFFNN